MGPLVVIILASVFVNINVAKAQELTKEELEQITKEIFTPNPTPNCTCVPYYQCDNGTINTSGEGLIDIKWVKEDLCPKSLEVCCEVPHEENKQKIPTPVGRRGCGHRNDQGIGFRITGTNNDAQFGEFPWMIGLLQEVNGNLSYICGGSLIHEQVVLTAAHCVNNKDSEKSKLYARAGEWDTQTSLEILPYQEKKVKKIIIHEKFYPAALYNDIALIILEEPFSFADNVDIICLPQGVNDLSKSEKCLATGWGKDNFEKIGLFQTVLKTVEMPMVSNDQCQDKLRTTRLGKFFKLHETFVCAGGVLGKDTCKGDGGSALICPVEGKPNVYKQVGIVAWGIGCGLDIPGVYVNIPYFRDWINTQMAANNFKTEYNYAI